MGSELPPPHSSPEMGPVQQGEINPNIAPRPAEQAPQRAPEQQPRVETRETKVGPGGASQPAPSHAPTLPPIVPPISDDTSAGQAVLDDNNPAIANDDDLIEKEWVDRAKKIVTETKSDPYRQEQEVNKLQADYLKKRWGKEINIPND